LGYILRVTFLRQQLKKRKKREKRREEKIMGSGYFGEPNLGNNERGGSSRKGKKSNSDKPKQPQRGLGVAQLEKIRLHGQMASDYHPSLHRTPYPTTFNQQVYTLPPSLYLCVSCLV
jgi:hypothetical protein